MPTDRFLIAPYDSNSGLQNNVKPWLIPDEAFSELNNTYVFRGRVRKRFGSTYINNSKLSSRLRINIGVTPGPLAIPPNTAGQLKIGQMFSVGNDLFTVYQLGSAVPTLSTNPAIVANIDSTIIPNTITFAFAAPGQTVYYYPANPVMGLLTYEIGEIENDPTIAFDTQFAYRYNPVTNGFERLATGSSVWVGNNSQFFWGTTWLGTNGSQAIFFVTNFDEDDPNFMRYFDGTTWTNFRPQINTTEFLNNARILVVFKNRLLALNTWEGVDIPSQLNYVNRCRYSQVGSPLDANSFRQDIPGRGNAIDAPTTESIITAQFVKDRLIVFFEKSTWELVYTGNQAYPFTWQKINTELGAESTFSQVPFDKVVLGVDNVGIHACNGTNVERIDDKIPDEVFKIHNVDQGIFRVYGIRDYKVEMVYWTFPDQSASNTFPFPNRVLVFNYKTGTWAFNDDSITAFGYFYEPPTGSITWDSTSITWDDPVPWDSGTLEVQFRQVIAGNQEGFVFIIDSDETTNAAVIQITNMSVSNNIITITAINHNLRVGDFIYIVDVMGSGNITLLNNNIFKVINVISADTFTIIYDKTPVVISGTYTGGGVFARVSKISIKTKEFNFYAKQGRNFSINKVDFMVDTTAFVAQCALDVNYFTSTSVTPLLQDGLANGTILGNGTLETFPFPSIPFEANTTRVIHPVYFWANGEFIQLQLTMNDQQMTTVIQTGINSFTGPTFVDFQLHFMLFHARPTSDRFQ